MPTFKQANASVTKESKLSQLDTLGQSFDDFIQENEFSIIESILGDFVGRVQANIESSGVINTGKMTDIEIKEDGNEVNVYAVPYLIYQDYGVNGAIEKLYNTPFTYKDKIPPIEDIKSWVLTKIKSSLNNPIYYGEAEFAELTDEEKATKAAWAISKSIYKKGIEPKNFYRKEIPQLVDDLTQELADFIGEAAAITITIKPK